jgi:hypothetical protein
MTRTIVTAGEIFGDASIELVRDKASEEPSLLLWDGVTERIAPSVQYKSLTYQPPSMSPSLWRELNLPTHCVHPGTTHDLFDDVRRLVGKFVGLPERLASLVARFALLTWLVEAVRVAPGLAVMGPDTHKGDQLMSLLHCLCRHPLRMGGVTPARLCSLPSAMGFTLLICQARISDQLQALLDDASRRDQKIPFHGELLDLYGCQVLHSEVAPDSEPSLRFVQVPMLPGSQGLSRLDVGTTRRISADFQPRLLGFRRNNICKAQEVYFDASKLTYPLRELAQSFAAATPDDAAMRAQLVDLLQQEDNDIRSARWTDLSTTIVEAVLVVCHEKRDPVYVGDLTEIAQEIRECRGEQTQLDSGAVGRRLKLLGFFTEPRDAKGVRLRITPEVCDRAYRLADDLGVPNRTNASKQRNKKDQLR